MPFFKGKPNLDSIMGKTDGFLVGRLFDKDKSTNRFLWIFRGASFTNQTLNKDVLSEEFLGVAKLIKDKLSTSPNGTASLAQFRNHSTSSGEFSIKGNAVEFWCFIDSNRVGKIFLEKGGSGLDFMLIADMKLKPNSSLWNKLWSICADDQTTKTCLPASIVFSDGGYEVKELILRIPDEVTEQRVKSFLTNLKLKA